MLRIPGVLAMALALSACWTSDSKLMTNKEADVLPIATPKSYSTAGGEKLLLTQALGSAYVATITDSSGNSTTYQMSFDRFAGGDRGSRYLVQRYNSATREIGYGEMFLTTDGTLVQYSLPCTAPVSSAVEVRNSACYFKEYSKLLWGIWKLDAATGEGEKDGCDPGKTYCFYKRPPQGRLLMKTYNPE